jgi:hypothetical protein
MFFTACARSPNFLIRSYLWADAPVKTYKLVVRSDGGLLRLEHQLLWNGAEFEANQVQKAKKCQKLS